MDALFTRKHGKRRAIGASRRLVYTGATMLGLLMGSAPPAYAHGVAAGDMLAPPLLTAGALGFGIYWLFILWPAPQRERGRVDQGRSGPRSV